jgi:hypothetical protein
VSGELNVTQIVDAMSITSMYAPASGSNYNPNFDFALFSVSELWLNTQALMRMFTSDGSYFLNTEYADVSSEGVILVYSTRTKQLAVSIKKGSTLAQAQARFNGVQLCYELATPQTYQLTPQQIDLLLGTNHLWSDGEITVEYGVHPYYNPTPFDAKPLIKVTGRGTLGIGEYILTITGTASQTLYIDCETMEIYTIEGTVPTGASSLVSINKNDFPVLEPGTNNISVGSGITAVTITPRWWRI